MEEDTVLFAKRVNRCHTELHSMYFDSYDVDEITDSDRKLLHDATESLRALLKQYRDHL